MFSPCCHFICHKTLEVMANKYNVFSLFQSHASHLIQIDIYTHLSAMTPYDLQCMHFRFGSPLLPICGQVWILVLRKAYGLTFQTQWSTLSHLFIVMLCITHALQLMCFYFWLWKILKDLFSVYSHAIRLIFSVMHSLMSLSLNNWMFL